MLESTKIVRQNVNLAYFLLLVGVAIAVHVPFLGHQFNWAFEPDAWGNICVVRNFYDSIEDVSFSNLWSLMGEQTYLDASMIITALLAHLVNFLVNLSILPNWIVAGENSLFIFSFRIASLIFIGLSVGFAFLCVSLVLKKPTVSLILVAVSFLLNPFFQYVDYLRVDHYLLFSSIFFMYACLRVLDDPERGYYLLGAALILNLSTKLNTPLYWTFPALFIVAYFNWNKVGVRQVRAFFFSALLVGVIVFCKWWIYPQSIIPYLTSIVEQGRDWYKVLDVTPYLFHHYVSAKPKVDPWLYHELRDVSRLEALIFVGSSVVSLLMSFYLVYQLIVETANKHRFTALLIGVFSVHSVGLLLSPTLYRYGIHMPFYYLMFAALTYHTVLENQRSMKWGLRTLVYVFATFSMISFGYYYSWALEGFKNGEEGMVVTKLAPRDWILENIERGARITTHSERNCTPPIWKDGFDMSPCILYYPWLDSTIVVQLFPPHRDSIAAHTDVILLSNYNHEHKPRVFERHVWNKDAGLRSPVVFSKVLQEFRRHDADTLVSQEAFLSALLSIMWLNDLSVRNGIVHYMLSEIGLDSITANERVNRVITAFGAEDPEAFSVLKYHDLLRWSEGNLTPLAWKQCYDDLPKVFFTKTFSSEYEYYQIRWQKVIVINESVLTNPKCIESPN